MEYWLPQLSFYCLLGYLYFFYCIFANILDILRKIKYIKYIAMEYNFREIEKKWQQQWVENKTYKVSEDESKKKFYV